MMARCFLLVLLASCGIENREPDAITQYGIEVFINDEANVNIELIDVATVGIFEGVEKLFDYESLDLVKRSIHNAVAITAENETTVSCVPNKVTVGCTWAHHIVYATKQSNDNFYPCQEMIVAHELAHVVATILAQPDSNLHNNPDLFGYNSVSRIAIDKVYNVCYGETNG